MPSGRTKDASDGRPPASRGGPRPKERGGSGSGSRQRSAAARSGPNASPEGVAGEDPVALPEPRPTIGLDQARALSHPLRLRLLELFATRPRTTMQAAEHLNLPPTRLYHHVAALERAGLVRVRETRRKRGTTEKYYETIGHCFVAGDDVLAQLAAPEAASDREAVGVMLFDRARSELLQALAAAGDKPPRAMVAVRAVLNLGPRAAERLAGELGQLIERLQSKARAAAPAAASRRRNRRRYSLTIALVPADQPDTSEVADT